MGARDDAEGLAALLVASHRAFVAPKLAGAVSGIVLVAFGVRLATERR